MNNHAIMSAKTCKEIASEYILEAQKLAGVIQTYRRKKKGHTENRYQTTHEHTYKGQKDIRESLELDETKVDKLTMFSI